jgi:hypothetical protein
MMTYSQRWHHPKLAGNIIWEYRPLMQKLTTEGEEAYEKAKEILHGMTRVEKSKLPFVFHVY